MLEGTLICLLFAAAGLLKVLLGKVAFFRRPVCLGVALVLGVGAGMAGVDCDGPDGGVVVVEAFGVFFCHRERRDGVVSFFNRPSDEVTTSTFDG